MRSPCSLTRGAAASIILGVHCGLLICLTNGGGSDPPSGPQAFESDEPPAAILAATRPPREATPLPLVHLSRIPFDETALTQIQFGDPDWDVVPGVISPVSFPHPAETSATSLFASRAGLAPGEAKTVVLNLEVLADGSIGQLAVVTSSGDAAVDQEAERYVLSLKWVPGSRNRHAMAMHIMWTVTLIASAAERREAEG
jgi:TonB family protein